MTSRRVPDAILRAISAAINAHYDQCRRNHGDNDGWFDCEADVIGAIPSVVAAFDLAEAAECWLVEMRSSVPGPCDQRLIQSIESYRQVVLP